MHAPSVSALGANGPNKSTTAVSLMSTTDSEPPSPTKVPDRYAPSAATVEPRDMSSSNTHSTWSSPVTALAVRVSKLPDSSVNALCGASAGVASGIVTCPLDVIKTRLQAQGSFRPRTYTGPTRAVYKGLTGTARVIWIEDGMRGLYRGLGPMLLGYIPTWAVYMSTYESTKNVLYPQMG
jgi:solute carrier family 25 folate transporter 32